MSERTIARDKAAAARSYVAATPPKLVWILLLLLGTIPVAAALADCAVLYQAFRPVFEDADGRVLWFIAAPLSGVAALSVIGVKAALQKLPAEVEASLAIAVAAAVVAALFFLGASAFDHVAADTAPQQQAAFDAENPFADTEAAQDRAPPSFVYGILAVGLVFLTSAILSSLKRLIEVLVARRRALSYLGDYWTLLETEEEAGRLRLLRDAIPESQIVAVQLVGAKALDFYSERVASRLADAKAMLDAAYPGGFLHGIVLRIRYRMERPRYVAVLTAIRN